LGAILFLCLFAAQSGLIALSPVLVQVAEDLGVSTATAGQLRTVAGLVAGVTALGIAAVGRRVGLRHLLVGGAILLAGASLASAVAPSFVTLALAQLAVGVAVAVLVTAATAAAAEWAPPEERPRVLSWALTGPPAAWIVGMPTIGLVGEASWRYAWVALPLVAAVAAALAARRGPRTPPRETGHGGIAAALADSAVRRWALGELLANSAWIGVLVYSGALFIECYDTSTTATGIVLAVAAAAFVAGNLTFRRFAGGDLRPLLIGLSLGMAVVVPLLGAVRPAASVSAVFLAVAAFLGGGRTLLGSAFGLSTVPERRVAVMAARAAANQFGYFVGSAVGGIALATSGYGGLGLVLGLLFVAAAASLARRPGAGFHEGGTRRLQSFAASRWAITGRRPHEVLAAAELQEPGSTAPARESPLKHVHGIKSCSL
jgi:predicted MFS family arabinose efflux permease